MEYSSMMVALWIVALACINALLNYFAQVFYIRYYQQHITFEPSATIKASLLQQLGELFFIVLVFAVSAASGAAQSDFFDGFIVTFLIFPLSRAAMALLFYCYIKYNPDKVTGKTVFQPPAARMLTIVLLVQQIIFLGLIAFFAPSEFIYGGITSLALTAVVNYFSKQPQINV